MLPLLITLALAYTITLKEYTLLRHNPYAADFNYNEQPDQYKFQIHVDNTSLPSVEPWPKSPRIQQAEFTLYQYTNTLFYFSLTDPNHKRWQVPELNHFNPTKQNIDESKISFRKQPFTLYFKNSKGSSMLSFCGESLKYFDKYLEIEVEFNSHRIFGLGEQITHFELPEGRYSLYNKDHPSPISDGLGGKGMYSTHPVYVIQQTEESNQFSLVYFRNSNPMDYYIKHYGTRTVVTHKSIGGIFEFYVVLLGSIDEVVSQYHAIIGLPYLPPFWSLGMHQCKWGYRSVWDLKRLVRKFDQSDVPLDVILPDIDYMNEYQDFTIDPVRFPNFKEFSDKLRKEGVHIMPNHDIGLSKTKTYEFYNRGMSREHSFIMSGRTNEPVVATVWPGKAVFPDFFSSNGTLLWWEGLEYFHDITQYDALMLDMEDISAFCDGECPDIADNTIGDKFLRYFFGRGKQIESKVYTDKSVTLEFDNLPYKVGLSDLDSRTVSIESYHYATNDYEKEHLKQYNLHNLYNYYENKYTHDFIRDKLQRRPYVVSRSTAPGSGSHCSKWLGDNFATWTLMRNSIVGMLNFQIFGVPHVGADICGFVGRGDDDLCARWYQLGSFSPFTRNQNFATMIPQEPYEFETLVVEAARTSIRQKYAISRYYYSQMFNVSVNGGMLIRAMFYDYPNDSNLYNEKEKTFMIGRHVLIVPVLQPKATNVSVYLPNEAWYDMRSFRRVELPTNQNATFDAFYNSTIVLIKGGIILPYHNIINSQIKRIRDLDSLPITLIIALNKDMATNGQLYVDNTDEPIDLASRKYRMYSFQYQNSELKISILFDHKDVANYAFEQIHDIVFLGAENIRQCKKAVIIMATGAQIDASCYYRESNSTLEVPVNQLLRSVNSVKLIYE